jgi:hypothetical protein
MRNQFFKIGMLLAFMAATGCGNSGPRRSNIELSEADAKAQLEARQKKTEEVGKVLGAFRDAIRDVSTFTDLGGFIDRRLGLEGNPGSRLRQLIERLKQVLDEATRGLVEFEEDGSWNVSRELPLPLQRENYGCKTSRLLVKGTKYVGAEGAVDGEYIKVYLVDCTSLEPIPFAFIRTPEGALPEIRFNLEALDQVKLIGDIGNSCRGMLGAREFSLECEPANLEGNGFTMAFERLSVRSVEGRASGSFGAAVWHHRSGKVYWVHGEVAPGSQPSFSCRQADINEPGREEPCRLRSGN